MRRNLKFLKIEHPVDKRIFVLNVRRYYIILVEYFSKKMVYYGSILKYVNYL